MASIHSVSTLLSSALLAASLLAPAQAADRPTFPKQSAVAQQPGVQPLSGPYIDVNLAGWTSFGDLTRPNNSQTFLNIVPGAMVTGFEFIGLSFSTENGSWLSELVLSVNSSDGSSWMDWSPSSVDDPGSESGLNGSFGGPVGAPGPFGEGGAFFADDGVLWVTVYDAFDDPAGDTGLLADAVISSGTLRIYVSAVPEPGSYGMMALGLIGIGAFVRRRQQRQ
jgi:hypothetical protein